MYNRPCKAELSVIGIVKRKTEEIVISFFAVKVLMCHLPLHTSQVAKITSFGHRPERLVFFIWKWRSALLNWCAVNVHLITVVGKANRDLLAQSAHR